MNGKGILALVVVVVVVVTLFFILRGRPAGELSEAPAAVSATAAPAPVEVLAPVPPGASTPGTPVSLTATGFSPATVTIEPQTGVTFTNDDTAPHQVASVPHPAHTNYPLLNGPVLDPGESFSVPFNEAGSYGYHDHLNPGVTGTVVVR